MPTYTPDQLRRLPHVRGACQRDPCHETPGASGRTSIGSAAGAVAAGSIAPARSPAKPWLVLRAVMTLPLSGSRPAGLPQTTQEPRDRFGPIAAAGFWLVVAYAAHQAGQLLTPSTAAGSTPTGSPGEGPDPRITGTVTLRRSMLAVPALYSGCTWFQTAGRPP